MIAVEDTDNGTVELAGVTINGIEGEISSDGWALRAGVQYTLELNLSDKEEEGIDIGGSVWAPGHLTYDPTTDTYDFTSDNQVSGSYFFPNYVKPKILSDNGDEVNQAPTPELNGINGDPCALIAPENTWRLPTVAEMEALRVNTNAGGQDNPGPGQHDPARWGDEYTAGGQQGMFFGTQSHPGEDRDKYLFIPYTGIYNNGPEKQEEGFGYYLLRNTTTNNFGHLQISGPGLGWSMQISESARSNSAYQIRCVQN